MLLAVGAGSPAAAVGFRLGGGWQDLAIRPALALAAALDGVDTRLLGLVLALGRFGLDVATGLNRFEDRELDGGITALGRAVARLGRRARALQSGLVVRELAMASAGAAVAVVVLLAVR
jgi:NADH-quinone oxidoreductase subunit L